MSEYSFILVTFKLGYAKLKEVGNLT